MTSRWILPVFDVSAWILPYPNNTPSIHCYLPRSIVAKKSGLWMLFVLLPYDSRSTISNRVSIKYASDHFSGVCVAMWTCALMCSLLMHVYEYVVMLTVSKRQCWAKQISNMTWHTDTDTGTVEKRRIPGEGQKCKYAQLN